MRSRPRSRSHQPRKVSPPASGARGSGSPGCGIATASRNAAASRTVRASGPKHAQPGRVEVQRALRHPPAGGLQPDQPAHAGRDADRAAAVAALRDGDEPAGHRRGRTAARSPGEPAGVPRRARRRTDVGLGVAGQPELGGGRLAQADRAGLAQQPDDVVVDVGNELGHHPRAELRDHTAGQVEVLDRGRHPVQRRQLVAGQHRRFGSACLLACALGGHCHERADLVVQPGDAGERVLDELDRRDLLAAHRRGRLERGQVMQFGHAMTVPTPLRPPRRCPGPPRTAARH